MKTRIFALVLGLVFLAVGVLGFVPRLVSVPAGLPPLRIEAMHGLLFGLFAVNALHNLVHLAFGVWGVVVWRSFPASRLYARVVAISYAVLTVLGLIPIADTLYGLVPLHGHDVWLHAAITIAGAYFGYAPVAAVETARAAPRRP